MLQNDPNEHFLIWHIYQQDDFICQCLPKPLQITALFLQRNSQLSLILSPRILFRFSKVLRKMTVTLCCLMQLKQLLGKNKAICQLFHLLAYHIWEIFYLAFAKSLTESKRYRFYPTNHYLQKVTKHMNVNCGVLREMMVHLLWFYPHTKQL